MELRAAAERISRARDAHLDSLSLSGAFIVHLEDLPSELTILTTLTRLDLSYNVLATLPSSLGELRSLTFLSASHNSLTVLPPALSSLSALTSLNLSFNRITSIPDVLLSALTSLRTLDFQRNRLSVLSPAVGALVRLESLNVTTNSLERLPTEIGHCKSLIQLAISGNALRTLPLAIANLTRLERLYASQNKLSLLPDACLTSLRALHELDLRDNALSLLPNSLSSLPSLKKLIVAGNERIVLPPSARTDDVQALITAAKSLTDRDRGPLMIMAASRAFPDIDQRLVAQLAAQCKFSPDELLRSLHAHAATLPPPALAAPPTGAERLIANYSPPPTLPAPDQPRTRRGTLTAVDVEDMARNRLVSALQTEAQFHTLLTHALSAGAYLAAPPALTVHTMDITRAVLENHLLIQVPGNAALFSTLAGVEGRFVQNQKGQRFIHLFRTRQRIDGQHDPLLNPADEFEEEVSQAEGVTAESKLVFDLTNGTVSNVSASTPTRSDDLVLAILHISAPLLVNGQPWAALRAPPLPTDWVAFSTSTFAGRLELPAGKEVKSTLDQFVQGFTKRPPPEDAQGETVRSFIATLTDMLEKHAYWSRLDVFERKTDLRSAESLLFTRIASALVPSSADMERDKHIAKQLRRLAWLEARHLDINPKFHNEELWDKAMRELRSMSSLPSPDEKLAAILNACKILIFLLTSAGSPAGADDFLPHLIYVTIKAAPARLSWNLRFIERFCDPEVLSMENLCFFTHLIFTVSFVESITPVSLTMDKDEFARRVKQVDTEIEKEEASRRMRSLFGGSTE